MGAVKELLFDVQEALYEAGLSSREARFFTFDKMPMDEEKRNYLVPYIRWTGFIDALHKLKLGREAFKLTANTTGRGRKTRVEVNAYIFDEVLLQIAIKIAQRQKEAA